MFFSRFVLPRVGAPRVTFVTKTAVKCMRPHSPGDSTSTEFLSHFSRSARTGPDSFSPCRPFSALPSNRAPVFRGGEGIRAWHNAKYLSSFAAAKILTPLRGDTTPLYSFDRNRSPFREKQKRRRAGLDGRVRICSVARIVPPRHDGSYEFECKDRFVRSCTIVQPVNYKSEYSALEYLPFLSN